MTLFIVRQLQALISRVSGTPINQPALQQVSTPVSLP